jgi:hypothetical protein
MTNRVLAKVFLIKFSDGQDAHPTREKTSCGMGKMPIPAIFAQCPMPNAQCPMPNYQVQEL